MSIGSFNEGRDPGTLGHWDWNTGTGPRILGLKIYLYRCQLRHFVQCPRASNTHSFKYICISLSRNQLGVLVLGRDRSCALGLQIPGHLAHMLLMVLVLLETLGQNSMNIIFRSGAVRKSGLSNKCLHLRVGVEKVFFVAIY